jgi:glycosyltransferase involved in cell wall biosynthesis
MDILDRMLRVALANLLDLVGGGRGLFQIKGQSISEVAKRVVVLSPGEIPTTDLYLPRRLEKQFGKEVRYVNTFRTSPREIVLDDKSLVVIVRHAPLNWLRWLKARHGQVAGVAFLMDDDIPAALRAPELPLGYAMKTAWRYGRSRRLLSRICSEVWLSTPELMQRYAGSSPRLLEPEYVAPQALKEKTLVYFYHGSWAHRREIEWLVPIVKLVQEAVPDAWFEIMGTDRVKHLFRGIPRVRVVHPMPWKDYLAYAGTVQYQIGLAPCFDTDFNRARSHSKMFDITRLGAAGIYSNVIPYSEKIVHGKTGMLCDNDSDKWIAAITLLLNDPVLRTSLYSGAMDWCAKSH